MNWFNVIRLTFDNEKKSLENTFVLLCLKLVKIDAKPWEQRNRGTKIIIVKLLSNALLFQYKIKRSKMCTWMNLFQKPNIFQIFVNQITVKCLIIGGKGGEGEQVEFLKFLITFLAFIELYDDWIRNT